VTTVRAQTPRPQTRRPRPLTAEGLGLPAEARKVGRRDGLTAQIRATLDTQVRVLLAEQATAGLAEEPESVHQMRVAARRARVALRMDREGSIGTARHLRDELAWLGTLLGGVRDVDVLCERLAEDGANLPETDLPAFGQVLSVLLASRSAAADVLVDTLPRQRYRALLRTLAVEALGPAGTAHGDPTSAQLLAKPVRALHLQLAASAQSPSDAGWHILRIRVKRVRYAAELIGRLAPREQRTGLVELARTARDLQEVLGAFHDTVVAEDHLRQLVVAHPAELSPAALLVLGRLVERQSAKRDALRQELPAACGQLYEATAKP
jgi:CHAD domain-containing protein